ncbi:unannotated protein [freshwater metagenome]|uniref:Unannotated protein n=1 Tax=freshwater metagenome TaxID=449393 RepID=A0A6J7IH87_9ZZZZ
MHVVVDGRHIGGGRGVARYSERVLAAMAALDEDVRWTVVCPGGPVPGGVRAVHSRLPRRAFHGAGALLGRPTLDGLAGAADVAWLPAPAPVALSPGLPYVLNVHDRSFEARPGDFTGYERVWHRFARPRALAGGAAAVMTLTRSGADELVAAGWPVPPQRLIVGGAGAQFGPTDELAQGTPPAGVPERYLLTVGALEPRKGSDVLAGAYAQARMQGLDATLVVAGRGRLRHLFDGAPGVVLLDDVDDAALEALYRNALAVAHPALLEGFGLPPVEAAAYAVPSIVADLPVYEETLGAAALRVPASDGPALAAAMLQLADDETLRRGLGEQARDAVAAHSWDHTAQVVLEALRTAAGR